MALWVIEGRKIGSNEWIPTEMTCSKASARHCLDILEPEDFERDGDRFEYRIMEYIPIPTAV